MAKMRLDVLLVEQGLFPSREQARTAIMSRKVSVDGQIVDKAGAQVHQEAALLVSGQQLPYVSRGGLKLAKAVVSFGLDFNGLVVADIGASTGGFTDCALQNGAARVYAVDVGYGQLAWKLRQDERVVVLEKTNARYLTTTEIPEPLDAATIDAAFISLSKLLPALYPLLKPEGFIMALIKPQFEVGAHQTDKGVVRDEAVRQEAVNKVLSFCENLGLECLGVTPAMIKGPKGNQEYVACWRKVREEYADNT